MTFDEKLNNCKSKFENLRIPNCTENEKYLYADFLELQALYKKEFSRGDANDLFYGEPEEDNSAEKNDNHESFLNELFNLLKERKNLFGDSYPFNIEYNTITIKSNLSNQNKVYIFLLLSSSLDIFNSFMTELTTDFESISYETLKKFLPSNAIIKSFGKNTEYKGNAKKKIEGLAFDIGLSVNKYEIDCIDERNNQERGLDVVGWIPFEDNCMNKVVFLCQCACGKNIISKFHDTRRYKKYYNWYCLGPQHTLFVPYSLINTREGKFYPSDDIEDDFLIFERKRILSLVCDTIFDKLKTKELVDTIIETKQ